MSRWISVALLFAIVTGAIFAPVIAPHDPNVMSFDDLLMPPSSQYLMGTDEFGRDILSRVLYAGRVSLLVAACTVAVGGVIGTTLGIVGGYYGKSVDRLLIAANETLLAFPAILLALALITLLGTGVAAVIVANSVIAIPVFQRVARAATLGVKELEMVTAARALGASDAGVTFRHILPNIASPLLVQAVLTAAFAILVEAGLSFLGLGVRPPTPSWGSMLNAGRPFIDVAPWISIVSGTAIVVAILALNLVGRTLQSNLNPVLGSRYG